MRKLLQSRFRCECSDPGCPVHKGAEVCLNRAAFSLRRIDMEDGQTKIRFCRACANDALDSGVFA
jgi:hypothetical protein